MTSDIELGGDSIDSALTLVKKGLFVSQIIPVRHIMQESLCSTHCCWCAVGRLSSARVGWCRRKPAWLLMVGKLEVYNWKYEDYGLFLWNSVRVSM